MLIARLLIPVTASVVINKTELAKLIFFFFFIIAGVLNLLKVAYLTIAFSQPNTFTTNT